MKWMKSGIAIVSIAVERIDRTTKLRPFSSGAKIGFESKKSLPTILGAWKGQ